ncbi:hypothetical protein [Methanoculleus sp. MH98A]|uniref:hypothetical protein n=1 Tax=Methanoculleus sp. MH98A TaxID=1495314 RepID=UPI0004A0652F|nr:hypothetical protein [Methanoculleus sp. MH98A]KDE54610.1 hypothetical protein EI28_12935 [Methanoculleus sp. MH98A]
MDLEDKTIVYAIIAACVLGIAVIGALVVFTGTSGTMKESFSELYFESPKDLPSVVDVGEPVAFAFSVVSHELSETPYTYTVRYDDRILQSGKFTLPAAGTGGNTKKAFSVNFTPDKPGLVRVGEPATTSLRTTYNGAVGVLASTNGTQELQGGKDRILLPADLSGFGLPDREGLLIFDPAARETFSTTTTSVAQVGSSPAQTTPAKDAASAVTGSGYSVSRTEWTIDNDHGTINVRKEITSTEYRYTYQKVSVDVASPSTAYEIHFWILVQEDPEVLRQTLLH